MPSETPPMREARALLGWLSDRQARSLLTGRRRDLELTDELRRIVEAARSAVAARARFDEPSPIVAQSPEVLQEHRAALYAHARFKTLRDDGWEIVIVDLAHVCVVQHTVLSEPDERINGVDPEDVVALASITLPIPDPQPLTYQIDSQRNVAMLSSFDGNLRVVGFAAQEVPRGSLMGFIVEIATSYLQVAEIGGRFLLRDGNRRAAHLFKRGVRKVPALLRRFGAGEDLGIPKGVLAPAIYLGERPPTVADYWDPAVSGAVRVPRYRKLVLIQGIEQSLAD